MSVRTIALTLMPTETERASLELLQERFSAACNSISEVAWREHEFNSVRLHRLVYRDVRMRFGLLAQHAVRAIAVVATSYKADKTRQHTFRRNAAIVLDTPRLYRIEHNRVHISTLEGRVKIALNIGGVQRRQIAEAAKLTEADLVCDHKGRWRLLVSAHYTDPPIHETGGVLGVDFGRTDIAVTSDGERFSGAQITAVRDRYAQNRRIKQKHASKGTRSTRRRCRALQKRLSGQERRFQVNVNHTISKRVVAQAVAMGCAIAIEDLTGVRRHANTQRRSSEERRRSNSWAFAQLRAYITYKCVASGVPLVVVNPRYTSQICHRCLHIGERTGKRFVCSHCGCCDDADINASHVIALLGANVMAPRGPWLACRVGYRASESLPLSR